MIAIEQRLTIITLGVSDLSVSENFYCEKLGWEKTGHSNKDIIFIKLNGILLSLYPKNKFSEETGLDTSEFGTNTITLAYNTRTKEEVDGVFQKLKTRGVRVVKKPQDVFWGGYSGYISDPDGYLWEIAYNPFMELDSSGNVK